MDWLSLYKSMFPQPDRDFPERTARVMALSRVLEGTQYDHISYDFAMEETETGDYVPLRDRRPSTKSNLCRTVVDDATALLFSEAHFPQLTCDGDETRNALRDLVKERSLDLVMIDAATKGSVGSVAILFRVLKRKPFFDVLTTEYLAPEWMADDPDMLSSVTEKYKVDAATLKARGYAVNEKDGKHWFMRVWDAENETWYLPWPVSEKEAKPKVDAARTVKHALGFVPIVWVRNLPGGGGVDGDCTFARGLDTVIELDYLMSQCARGLRYASDPTLMIAKADDGAAPARKGGAANALILPPEGDAKLLEINGSAANAVLEHARELRASALEMMHGSRAHADKLSMAQSGRAMEMMNQGLIWLADRMRLTYGETALMSLLRMVCEASQRISGGLLVAGKPCGKLDVAGLRLTWPAWYQPTHADKQADANALGTALAAGIISRQTAVTAAASTYGVEDIEAEMLLIQKDQEQQLQRELAVKAAVQVKENAPA